MALVENKNKATRTATNLTLLTKQMLHVGLSLGNDILYSMNVQLFTYA